MTGIAISVSLADVVSAAISWQEANGNQKEKDKKREMSYVNTQGLNLTSCDLSSTNMSDDLI